MAKTHTTLFPTPPLDECKAPIENVFELTLVPRNDGQAIFTNTHPLWHPSGSRGVYGGTLIAQSLSAAMLTFPSTVNMHSMHCHFLIAATAETPIYYYIDHVNDGDRLVTCMVKAKQRNHLIFTAAVSFINNHSSMDEKVLEHSRSKPDVSVPQDPAAITGEGTGNGLFESRIVDSDIDDLLRPSDKRYRRFVRLRGTMSNSGGSNAHILALAYLTDTYFIGTLWRVYNLSPYPSPPPTDQEEPNQKAEEIELMASLNHSIYLHHPQAVRVDDWMLTEMETPWAGNERGLVVQRIWSTDGILVATCIQEALVRLKQHQTPKHML
ncbi:acyl-CoA thioesterase II [Penicillium cf. viridicatum]|uniref:Acyl-CoA thioesterase II n=1 Tax=Penicillium cf. viridicatum TaxID=2972119 RepID=A0A9W9JGY3_9EURO|nr:acyl-CoA thioesterase II [Penicillium cf. viridicatum]